MGDTARRGRWIPVVYYYVATTVGLVMMLVGLVGGLQGAAKALLPTYANIYAGSGCPYPVPSPASATSPAQPAACKRDQQDATRRQGVFDAIQGLITAAVGAPVFGFHLRHARRREPQWLGE